MNSPDTTLPIDFSVNLKDDEVVDHAGLPPGNRALAALSGRSLGPVGSKGKEPKDSLYYCYCLILFYCYCYCFNCYLSTLITHAFEAACWRSVSQGAADDTWRAFIPFTRPKRVFPMRTGLLRQDVRPRGNVTDTGIVAQFPCLSRSTRFPCLRTPHSGQLRN